MRKLILFLICISANAFASDKDTVPGLKICIAAVGSDKIHFGCCATKKAADQILIVIDGTPVDSFSLSKINPDDISRIEVLKNSAAMAIYGCRATNGVIIITTKRNNRLTISDADNKLFLQGATVKIQPNNKLNRSVILVADENGEIDLSAVNSIEEYSMEISCIGYQTMTITASKHAFNHAIKMQKKYELMDSVFIFSNEYSRKTRCGICYLSRVDRSSNLTQVVNPISVSLYPNPIRQAGTLTLNLLQPITGKADLINTLGEPIQTINLYEENANPVIHLSNAMLGCYFVRITDSKSHKVVTQKLIVQ